MSKLIMREKQFKMTSNKFQDLFFFKLVREETIKN